MAHFIPAWHAPGRWTWWCMASHPNLRHCSLNGRGSHPIFRGICVYVTSPGGRWPPTPDEVQSRCFLRRDVRPSRAAVTRVCDSALHLSLSTSSRCFVRFLRQSRFAVGICTSPCTPSMRLVYGATWNGRIQTATNCRALRDALCRLHTPLFRATFAACSAIGRR